MELYTILSIWGDSPSNLYAIGQKRGDQNEAIYLSWSGGSSWVRESTFPGSNPTSVRGFIGHDVYISGSDGVYRLINGSWANYEKILTDSFNDIWGASHESIWFVGDSGITRYNGATSTELETTTAANGRQISGNSVTEVFTVTGSDGEIFHFQGQAWSSMTAIPISPANSICGYSDDALFAVGDNGVILFYDGIQWSPMESPTNNNLYSVCGGGNAVFAAGEDGAVLFYNGSQWSLVNSGTEDQQLYDTWCHGGASAFIVGSNGTILNCTGVVCSAEATDGTTATLYAVHHSDMGPYAGGDNGVMMHKATTTWNQIDPVPTGTDVRDLWGDAGSGILLAGGDEYIHSYNTFTKAWELNYGDSATLSIAGLVGTTSADLYVIGRDGTYPYDGVVLHRENGSLQPIQEFTEQPLLSACLIDSNLFIGSDLPTTASTWGGTLFRYNMTSWSGMLERRSLRDIWGSSPDDLFVVGDTGAVMHYDGQSWKSSDQRYNVTPPQYLNATWGRSKKDIFAFGSKSYRKGTCSVNWELHSKPGLPPFESVWGMQGADDMYYLFAIADTGNAVYQYTISGDRTCSSSWPLFLPAILSE